MSEKEKKDASRSKDSFERPNDMQRKLALAYARGLTGLTQSESLTPQKKSTLRWRR